jgi:hypothetical protein
MCWIVICYIDLNHLLICITVDNLDFFSQFDILLWLFSQRIHLNGHGPWRKYGCSLMLVLSWVLVPCGFVGQCQHFRETHFHHQGWSDRAGKWRVYVGFEEGRLRERGQSEKRNVGGRMQPNRGPSSRLWGGLGRQWSKRRISPFQRPPEGVMSLFSACFHFFRSQMRGFHDLLSEKPLM